MRIMSPIMTNNFNITNVIAGWLQNNDQNTNNTINILMLCYATMYKPFSLCDSGEENAEPTPCL
jgi:hypothetical protein